ncbi:MAG: hypothetical protein B6244_02495 [Candidatus Cloacimonetes bacterium 4572_55]|nr:MAG: hypothetical protein B6244_02495 [Candidatus Cloacimonetes bacterium 4572_55]
MSLNLDHIQKTYQTPSGRSLTIFRDVSLEIKQAESVAIMGPSGSGKSSLLNIMGGLDRPDSGRVTLDREEFSALSESELAAVRNQKIGFVFQLHHLLPQCTALENTLIPTLINNRLDAEESETRARQLLERVGLADRIDHRPGSLSGGECQRVAVARALINQPKVLLADEPTGSLDRDSSNHLMQLLLELNREEGVILIIATHSQELARKMERILTIRDLGLS